jgi:hypothetical protein
MVASAGCLRLERGRDKNPSPQVLESLARVLHLDELEQEYRLGLKRSVILAQGTYSECAVFPG